MVTVTTTLTTAIADQLLEVKTLRDTVSMVMGRRQSDSPSLRHSNQQFTSHSHNQQKSSTVTGVVYHVAERRLWRRAICGRATTIS